MKKILSIILVFFLIWSCSPEKRLSSLKKNHGELFLVDSLVLDSIIKSEALKLNIEMLKRIDSMALEEADAQEKYARIQAYLAEYDIRKNGIKDCDTVIKYMDRIIKAKGEKEIIYRDTKCQTRPIHIDTLDIFIDLDSNGSITIKPKDKHVRKAAQYVIPKCVEREYWQYWQFIAMCILCLFLLIALVKK